MIETHEASTRWSRIWKHLPLLAVYSFILVFAPIVVGQSKTINVTSAYSYGMDLRCSRGDRLRLEWNVCEPEEPVRLWLSTGSSGERIVSGAGSIEFTAGSDTEEVSARIRDFDSDDFAMVRISVIENVKPYRLVLDDLPDTEHCPSVLNRKQPNGSLYDFKGRATFTAYTIRIHIADGPAGPLDPLVVRVRIVSDRNSGWHESSLHGNSAPPSGWLFGAEENLRSRPLRTSLINEPVAANFVGGVIGGSSIERPVAADRSVSFKYLPPENAMTGHFEFELVRKGHIIATERHDIFVAMTDDDGELLKRRLPEPPVIDGVSAYEFVTAPGDEKHPQRFAVKKAVAVKIRKAAVSNLRLQRTDPTMIAAINKFVSWRSKRGKPLPRGIVEEVRSPRPFYINDISLPMGGIFDITGNYTVPHGGHRWGDQVDIKTTHLAKNWRQREKTVVVTFPKGTPEEAVKDPELVKALATLRLRQLSIIEEVMTAEGASRTLEDRTNHFHFSFR